MGWRNYDGRKVFYLNTSDTEYIEFEHCPPAAEQRKIIDELTNLEKNQDNISDETTIMSLKIRRN